MYATMHVKETNLYLYITRTIVYSYRAPFFFKLISKLHSTILSTQPLNHTARSKIPHSYTKYGEQS